MMKRQVLPIASTYVPVKRRATLDSAKVSSVKNSQVFDLTRQLEPGADSVLPENAGRAPFSGNLKHLGRGVPHRNELGIPKPHPGLIERAERMLQL